MGFDSLTPSNTFCKMNATDKRRIEKMMEDTIMEMPIGFEVGGVDFFLYPVTLGRAYLITREREGMADNLIDAIASASEEVRENYRKSISRIVAIQTLRSKDEIFDYKVLNERTEYIYQNADDKGLCGLYDMIMASMEDASVFIKAYGLDYDKRDLAKIAKIKSDGGNISFGAKTAYGSFIGSACEKFGWTMEYVVWGISLTNLEMLLADASTSVYLTKDERRKLKISTDRTVIDAGDPANKEKIRQILKGN